MKKRNKRLIWLLAVVLLMSLIGGCKKEEPVVEEPEEIIEEVVEEKEEEIIEEVVEEPEVVENENLLTGLPTLTDEAVGKRPVAVMVNNIPKALPQYGIDQADVIFEVIVEGDQTRLMALYGDYTQVPKICSVRSCRKYFPIMSEGFDAVYINWGMSKSTRKYVETLDLTNYDGIYNSGNMFARDEARKNAGYAIEHTGYFDGTKLPGVMAEKGDRVELAENKTGTAFLFNGVDEQIKAGEQDCSYVKINFGAMNAEFNYDEETKTYFKLHNGNAHVDGVTGAQLQFTNVLVLETTFERDGSTSNKWFDWTGGEDSVGYYVSNGGVQKIHWEKENDEVKGYLKFYKEDGTELSINRGKTYIAINHKEKTVFEVLE